MDLAGQEPEGRRGLGAAWQGCGVRVGGAMEAAPARQMPPWRAGRPLAPVSGALGQGLQRGLVPVGEGLAKLPSPDWMGPSSRASPRVCVRVERSEFHYVEGAPFCAFLPPRKVAINSLGAWAVRIIGCTCRSRGLKAFQNACDGAAP